jgi:hypothetical protein
MGEQRAVSYDIVVPTIGRPSLTALVDSLRQAGAGPHRFVVVDDRSAPDTSFDLPEDITVLRSEGRGPAVARNIGAQHGEADWIVFLDDDVVVSPEWTAGLLADLRAAESWCSAVGAQIDVPMPSDRRPTDWERNVGRLADARWITADLAVRRRAFDEVGGFDERFPRAYREDSDLALRLMLAGHAWKRGVRQTTHPVRPAGFWVSVKTQAGNEDDALMRRKHGPRWRAAIGEAPPAMTWYAAVVTAAGWAVLRRGRPSAWFATALCIGALGGFTVRRLRGGPWTRDEIARMVATTPAIPPVAVAQRLRGEVRQRADAWRQRSQTSPTTGVPA